MVALDALVVNEPVPPTVAVPESVRLPADAVALRLPPTADVARVSAEALTMVAKLVATLLRSSEKVPCLYGTCWTFGCLPLLLLTQANE